MMYLDDIPDNELDDVLDDVPDDREKFYYKSANYYITVHYLQKAETKT